jgi:hypothetical protein
LEESEQLPDDGLEGEAEAEAHHEHLPVKEDIPGIRLREDILIRFEKVKLHGRQNIVVVVEEGFVHRRIHRAKPESVPHIRRNVFD